ncbi:MAG: mevalonate kinase [Candidatus Bathyarchaeota archaeon]|nr:MAG: mevalonate kinase [Candidatus Bathyarchaeota archaeon]
MGRGSGFGKAILFGEHFVVYGLPGIVSAIDLIAEAEVKSIGDGITISDERKGAKGYTEKKRTQQKEAIERMLENMGINSEKRALEIWLGGNLPGFSGIGASAASSVAIAKAIAEEFRMNLSIERINEIAYEAEKAYAGTPSGIDNTAATYGGLIWFIRNLSGGPSKIERLSIKKPVRIVIGNTGIVANTKGMIAAVAKRKKANPEKYDLVFNQAKSLIFEARRALEDFDLVRVGRLMNENHGLLQEIEVSCKELDYLVNRARERGAIGAKLTGGGGGGCMVALTPGRELQEAVATAMEGEGFRVLRTKTGINRRYEENDQIRNRISRL